MDDPPPRLERLSDSELLRLASLRLSLLLSRLATLPRSGPSRGGHLGDRGDAIPPPPSILGPGNAPCRFRDARARPSASWSPSSLSGTSSRSASPTSFSSQVRRLPWDALPQDSCISGATTSSEQQMPTILLSLFVVWIILAPTPMAAQEQSATLAALQEYRDAWRAAWNRRDTKALGALMAEDVDWIAADGTWLKG